MLAVVFQDVKLLPMTIAQNVASDVGTNIDRERVRECLKLSGLWQKVSSLPKKEDTPLGASILDDGIALSGGENQKLWMARALYKNAPMLLLDEPTAVLTPLEVEQLLQILLEMKKEGKTIIFITHKLKETMAVSDHVTILRSGKSVEFLKTTETTEKELAALMVGYEIDMTLERKKAVSYTHLTLPTKRIV